MIVGGGQAGLAAAYELKLRGVDSLSVLEGGREVGDQWRRRWDSLKLFTPRRHDSLPGSTFAGDPDGFPGKDEVAAYLGWYAREKNLPVRTGVRVEAVRRTGREYLVETSEGPIAAEHVVVATGYERPKLPALAAEVDPGIRQLHASEYRNPSQLVGDVLVVGAGTSGVEISIEAARSGHRTTLAGRPTGAIPPIFYAFKGRVFWFFATRIASLRTPIGRRMRPVVQSHGAPLIRLHIRDASAAGVLRAPRVEAVEDGLPVVGDKGEMRPGTIVWCTGFTRDYSWIEIPMLGPDGYPRQQGGVVDGEPGLYFVGLPFQTRLASGLLGGVGHDAALVAGAIAGRMELSRRAAPVGAVPAIEAAVTG